MSQKYFFLKLLEMHNKNVLLASHIDMIGLSK